MMLLKSRVGDHVGFHMEKHSMPSGDRLERKPHRICGGIERKRKLLEVENYSGYTAAIQDCWRMRDRNASHDAVRKILENMKVDFKEIPENREKADFCGKSLYRPQVERNPKLAPKHYKENTDGLFEPHSEEEQIRLMVEYCKKYETEKVICYCHYCLEGLLEGGVDGVHLAQLLFG